MPPVPGARAPRCCPGAAAVGSLAWSSGRLGRSGLKVSEISYGNWLTHGSQVEADQATACVHEALEVGITTFDTADVYAGTKAETVLGEALKGVQRESYELFTKVYWPTGPGAERPRPVAQAHPRVLQRLAEAAADRPHRPLPGAPLRLRDAARGDAAGLRRPRAPGQGAVRRRQRVEGLRDRGALKIADEMGFDRIVSSQPQYSMLWRVIEAEVVPLCEREGVGPGRVVADRAGRAHRQVPAGPAAARGHAGPPTPTAAQDDPRWLRDDVLERVQRAQAAGRRGRAVAGRSSPSPGCCRTRTSSSAIVGASRPEQVRDNAAAAGKKLDADLLAQVDEVLEGVVTTDPAKTESPAKRP